MASASLLSSMRLRPYSLPLLSAHCPWLAAAGRAGSSVKRSVACSTAARFRVQRRPLSSSTSPPPSAPATASAQDYTAQRTHDLQASQPDGQGVWPYPNQLTSTHTIKQYVHEYQSKLQAGERPSGPIIQLSGRIQSKRSSSHKLHFYHLIDDDVTVQLICMANKAQSEDDFHRIHNVLRRGDIVHVRGTPGSSKSGELSIIVQELQLLAPCLHDIPMELQHTNVRHRQRYLDMLVDSTMRDRLRVKAAVHRALRGFLEQHHFMEVETPILWTSHGGANAAPFTTTSNAYGASLPLYLRIAPELHLKQLIIGGLNRVYELGKVFRNEGIDHTHSPEFTSLEFYMAYSNASEMMQLTEELFRHVVQSVTGRLHVTLQTQQDAPVDIDFSKPFQRIDIVTTLQQKLNQPLPVDVNAPGANAALHRLCEAAGCLPAAVTTAAGRVDDTAAPQQFSNSKLLDKLIEKYIEPMCEQPTFLTGHPVCMSPLARSDDSRPTLTERFELFISHTEYCNAYSELNDPQQQRGRFQQQALEKQRSNDPETHPPDEAFCVALEHGMPPTSGFGLGVDRLVMLLTQQASIREVTAFPLIRPHDAKDKHAASV